MLGDPRICYMKTTIGINLAVITVVLSFLGQPVLLAAAKMQECMMKDGHVMMMDGKPMGTCVMMKDGKMMMSSKGGKMMPMKKDMTMPDGTKCMVNGTCVMKNGKKMTMKEGQVMDNGLNTYQVKGLTLGNPR